MPQNYQDLNDAQLAESIVRRDESALAEVYKRHSGHVSSLSNRLLRNRALAEDIVQEVFVRLWNNPERFDPERGSLRAFLLSHTHGRSVDLIRSESARRAREERDLQLVPHESVSLEDEVWQLSRAEAVREALQALTEEERRCIELAYFGGRTYREVAQQLDAPEGTVKSRIRSGLKKLHRELGQKAT